MERVKHLGLLCLAAACCLAAEGDRQRVAAYREDAARVRLAHQAEIRRLLADYAAVLDEEESVRLATILALYDDMGKSGKDEAQRGRLVSVNCDPKIWRAVCRVNYQWAPRPPILTPARPGVVVACPEGTGMRWGHPLLLSGAFVFKAKIRYRAAANEPLMVGFGGLEATGTTVAVPAGRECIVILTRAADKLSALLDGQEVGLVGEVPAEGQVWFQVTRGGELHVQSVELQTWKMGG
jgi:hypothetical protein